MEEKAGRVYMDRKEGRVIFPKEIGKDVREKCAPIGTGKIFTFRVLVEALRKYVKDNDNLITGNWRGILEKKKYSTDTLEKALPLNKDCLAIIALSDLLCAYTYEGLNFEKSLKKHGMILEKILEESKKIKNVTPRQKEIETIHSKLDEIKTSGSDLYKIAELLLHKAMVDQKDNLVNNYENMYDKEIPRLQAAVKEGKYDEIKFILDNFYQEETNRYHKSKIMLAFTAF